MEVEPDTRVNPEPKEAVRRHWQVAPCGDKLAASERGSPAYFAEVEATRYRAEPFIPAFAEFGRWRDRRVLEVGVGLGTDFVQFARAGARLSGIDLTEAAVDLTTRRLQLDDLEAELRVGDAERLPFQDESFDLVYSWGVLHHTPDTTRAISEVHRVVKPGGEARIMLYGRHSWVGYGLWIRYALLRGRPRRSLADVIANHMESPGTKAYTTDELRGMFGAFSSVEFDRWVTPYDRRVAGPFARFLGSRLGWFVGIRAVR